MKTSRSTLTGVVFAVVIACFVALTGCSDGSNNSLGNSDTPFADASQSTCFTQMTPDQKAQLTQYVASQNNTVGSTTNNANGTQDVCVLEPDGSGGYNQHYYNQQDHFSDYLLYSMLFGQSSSLLAYSAISGDLDMGQVLALSLLTGVNSNGQMYHPYIRSGADWGRDATPIGSNVSHVRYGSRTPVSYSSSIPYPPGYKPVPLSFKSDSVAKVTKSANGKVSLTKTTAKASDTLKSFPKSVAPAPKSGTTSNKSGSSGSNKSGSSSNKSSSSKGGSSYKSGGSSRSGGGRK